jgi:hypothetical protein
MTDKVMNVTIQVIQEKNVNVALQFDRCECEQTPEDDQNWLKHVVYCVLP